ncbi:MAG: DUF2937 family protein [Acetobacteraceae bacterium]
MIGFLGRWLSDCVQLTCMLAGALLFMQVPALTHSYTVALQQVAQDARRDIDRRVEHARLYYRLAPEARDQAVVDALRPLEPSNAEMLGQSMWRAMMLGETQEHIEAAPPLSRPLFAAWDAVARPEPDKLAVLRTSVATYAPQIPLDVIAVIYGIAGLLLGGLLGHSLSAAPAAASRRLRRTRRA